jgi:hypothetical protein
MWSAVASSPNGSVIIAADGAPGYLYVSSDSGANWTAITSAGSRAWSAVAASGDGSKLFAADRAGFLYRSTNGGVGWAAMSSSRDHATADWRSLSIKLDGTIIVAATGAPGVSGGIYISTDSGLSWPALTGTGSHDWSGAVVTAYGNGVTAVASDGYMYTHGEWLAAEEGG